MRREYQKPRIFPHTEGAMNKFGPATGSYKDAIDGARVAELVQKYGSPLFVFSERTIRDTYRKAAGEFAHRYPQVQYSWSYKTNYLDAICQIFHQEGSWAEVVSQFEYEKALRLGVPGEQIIFNGPYKPYEALRQAVKAKSKINVDNMEEIFNLEKLAVELRKPIDLGIRVNLDAGIYPAWTRFGFNLENDAAFSAVEKMHSTGKLRLKGLHCHLGTFILEPKAYRTAVQKLAQFARRLRDELAIKIEYLDLGGGFPSTNTLHTQYLPGNQTNPTVDEFARVICDELLLRRDCFSTPPLLILETGRAMIDESGYLVASVVGSKRLTDGTPSLILDAGVNLLFTSTWYKHNVIPTRPHSEFLENMILYGPLCMNIDVVRPMVQLPALAVGEQVLIHPVGAYNVTQWMQFIQYRPAVVLVDEAGKPHEIRAKEDLDYMTRLESVPEHLRERKRRVKHAR
ncbi:MAG TPA: alanine racemase [Candidatus Ozemobacteraceae bacterium]|nr:alanine racemase [Candidatus Ozemobacteraceae bacterium]